MGEWGDHSPFYNEGNETVKEVSLKEFLKLPPGTIYEYSDTRHSDSDRRVYIKADTNEVVDADWWECNIGTNPNEIVKDPVTHELTTTCALDTGFSRHALYPDLEHNDYTFWVYEPIDVLNLVAAHLSSLVRQTIDTDVQVTIGDPKKIDVPFIASEEKKEELLKLLANWVNTQVVEDGNSSNTN